MLTMSGTLAAAGRKGDVKPYVTAKIADHGIENPHLEWSQLYEGSEGDQYNDAVIAADGSIVRCRSAGGALNVQRVTDPTVASQWTTWTTLESSGLSTQCQLALVAGAGTEVRIFWLDSADERTIKWRRSTNYGATWGSAAVVLTETAGRTIKALAGDGYTQAGSIDDRLFYTWGPGGTGPDKQLAMTKWNGSSWDAPTYDGELRYPIKGIAVGNFGSGPVAEVLIADGSASGGRRIALKEHDPATGWGSSAALLETAAGSNYDYELPRIVVKRTGLVRHWLGWVERYTATPTRDTFWTCFTPVRWWVTEPVAWKNNRRFGTRLLRSSSHWYVIGSDHAYRAPVFDGAGNQTVQVTTADDLNGFICEQPGPMRPGRLVVALDNSSGKFSRAGTAGAYRSLREGSQVALGLGYRTSAGYETVYNGAWFIDKVVFIRDRRAGVDVCELHCIDPWTYLDRFVVRRPIQLSNISVSQIAQRLWWRVSGYIPASEPAHTNMATALANFALRPGESYLSALLRLCEMAGLVLRWRGNGIVSGAGWDSVVPSLVAYGTGTSVEAYGTASGYALKGASQFWNGGREFGSIEVYGSGVSKADHPWSYISEVWRDTPKKVADLNMDSQTKVDNRATYEMDWIERSGKGGMFESNLDPGLELGDVVAVTDSNANLSGALRVVVGLRSWLDTHRGEYRQRITVAEAI